MDDLTRAVSQFLHSPPVVGISGGFNQPPAPEGSSGLPVFPINNENLDQPGPSALEEGGRGEDPAIRDWKEERDKIEALREDPYLGKAVQNSYIIQEEIIIEMKKAISPGEAISNRDIREGVELYLVELIQHSEELASSRNGQLRRILRSLREFSFFQNPRGDRLPR